MLHGESGEKERQNQLLFFFFFCVALFCPLAMCEQARCSASGSPSPTTVRTRKRCRCLHSNAHLLSPTVFPLLSLRFFFFGILSNPLYHCCSCCLGSLFFFFFGLCVFLCLVFDERVQRYVDAFVLLSFQSLLWCCFFFFFHVACFSCCFFISSFFFFLFCMRLTPMRVIVHNSPFFFCLFVCIEVNGRFRHTNGGGSHLKCSESSEFL